MKSVLVVLVLLATTWIPTGSADPCIDPQGSPPISDDGQCTMPRLGLGASASYEGNVVHFLVYVYDSEVWVQYEITCVLNTQPDPQQIDPMTCTVDSVSTIPSPPPLVALPPAQIPRLPMLP